MSALPAAAGQQTPRGTGITFLVCELRSGLVLDELPLRVDQLADTIAREEQQTFTLDVHDEACPDDWHNLLTPGKHMLVAVNTEQQPVIGWAVLGTEVQGPQVSISCATLEHCLARVNVDTVEAYETDEAELARLVANKMSTTHGFTVSASNTGQLRDAYYVAEEEDRSVYDALAELMAGEGGPEWHIRLDWAPGPWQVIGTNRAKNPSMGTDTNSWSTVNGTGGAATATRETSGGAVGTAFRRITWTTGTTAVGGGHQTTTTAFGLIAANPGERCAASLYVRSNRAQTVRLAIVWRDASNANIGNAPGASIPLSPNTWTRISVADQTAPAGAVGANISALAVAGGVNWQAGDTLDADALLFEASGTVVNSYYDGDTPDTTTETFAWTGTPHASTSTRSTRSFSRQYLVKTIEIAQRIGLDRPDVVFELDADGVGNIASYSRNTDYTSDRGATLVWAGAEGAGESRPLSQKYTSALVNEGWPIWEARPQITGLDKPTILNPDAALERRARAELGRRERGARVWALEGDADSPRPVHDFGAGDIVYVNIAPQGKRDPEGGVFAARVVAWSWNLDTGAVTPEVWQSPDGDQMVLNIDPRLRPPRGLRDVWEQIKRNQARTAAALTSPTALLNTQVTPATESVPSQSFGEWKATTDDTMDQLNTDLAENQSVLTQLQTDLSAAQTTLTTNSGAITQLQTDLDLAESSLTQLQTDVAAIDVSGLQTDLDAAEAAVAQLQTDLGALDTEVGGILPITETDISDGAVTTNKVLAGAIVTAHMLAGTIQGDRITANTLNADRIVAGSIGTDRMTANTINGDRITANTLNASKIVAGSITTDRMTANTINGDRITANTLNADRVVAGSITTDRMTANTINGDRIAANTLHADKIIAGTISTAHLAATAIDSMTVTGALYRTAASGSRVELGVNPASASTTSDEMRVYHSTEGVGAPALRIRAISTGLAEYVAGAGVNRMHRFTGPVEVGSDGSDLWALAGMLFRSGGTRLRGIDFGEFSGNTNASQKVSPSHSLGRVPSAVICIPTQFRSSHYHPTATAEYTSTQFVVYPRAVTTGALLASGTNVNFTWIAIA